MAALETKVCVEVKYPIYYVTASWIQDEAVEKYASDGRHEWLPPGRVRNGTGRYVMFRTDIDIHAYAEELKTTWWPGYLAKYNERLEFRYPIKNATDLQITVELSMRETWCGGWFSHWTFDTFADDQEVLCSFASFVDRMSGDYKDLCGKPYHLMGAEDRWSWHGRTHGAPDDEDTPPPCRCEGCKAQGIVRIDH
jgi:hypothetical protein